MNDPLWVWRREADGKYITFDGWGREYAVTDPEKACFSAVDEQVASTAYRHDGCVLERYVKSSSAKR